MLKHGAGVHWMEGQVRSLSSVRSALTPPLMQALCSGPSKHALVRCHTNVDSVHIVALLVVFWFHPPAPVDWGNAHVSDIFHFAALAECVMWGVGTLTIPSKAEVHVETFKRRAWTFTYADFTLVRHLAVVFTAVLPLTNNFSENTLRNITWVQEPH